jgi:uncharacterized protein YukE
MGDVIDVDFDALDQLANRLQSIKTMLESTKADKVADPAVFGDEKVSHAVHQFIVNWSQGRGQIVKELDQMVKVIQGAAKAYRETDRALKDNMSQTAAGQGGSAGPSAAPSHAS